MTLVLPKPRPPDPAWTPSTVLMEHVSCTPAWMKPQPSPGDPREPEPPLAADPAPEARFGHDTLDQGLGLSSLWLLAAALCHLYQPSPAQHSPQLGVMFQVTGKCQGWGEGAPVGISSQLPEEQRHSMEADWV